MSTRHEVPLGKGQLLDVIYEQSPRTASAIYGTSHGREREDGGYHSLGMGVRFFGKYSGWLGCPAWVRRR